MKFKKKKKFKDPKMTIQPSLNDQKTLEYI